LLLNYYELTEPVLVVINVEVEKFVSSIIL